MKLKNTLTFTVIALAALSSLPVMASDRTLDAPAAITKVLKNYERALNAADVTGVTKLYTNDGVFMSPNHPPAVGISQVTGAYTGVFTQIVPTLSFNIAEIKLLGKDFAMARSTSSGSIKIVVNGAVVPDAFQELFMLQKQHGQWKIARYSFSSTNPAK
jgi:uncharacterized protein (TIGR02246 family)